MNSAAGPQFSRASTSEIAAHLRRCDREFRPSLSARVDIDEYAAKLWAKAERFESWDGDVLVGLLAVYCNDAADRSAFITSVSVLPEWAGRGIATALVGDCIAYCARHGARRIGLEVACDRASAIHLYEKLGFTRGTVGGGNLKMKLELEKAESMNDQRDYDQEIRDNAGRRYAYGFDFDVMHPYMLKSFEPFFGGGSALELGSYQGHFTKRLLRHFPDLTCVEASEAALAEARRSLGDQVTFVHASFETANLPHRYDHIVLTHVLEHLDDPVKIIRRINDEWLSDRGRLFLVCPNANAPSRQIAVKMGLISHNSAVTPAEAEHGHRRTYALDTLERDALAGGLEVIHRSGIFFKALANFQWDRLLQTDIVSKEYLDGCYHLGQQYPELCASIFLVCERGRSPKSG